MEDREHAHPPWGPRGALVVGSVYAGIFIGLQIVSVVVLAALGFDLGEINNDREALTVLLAFTLVQQGLSIWLGVLALGLSPARIVDGLGLTRWRWTWVWRPALMTLALYMMVAVWSVIMNLLGVDLLEPKSAVDEEFVSGPLLVVISFLVIVIGAPLSEEFVFRGAIFGGLLRWGFWPAALLSGMLFGAVHLDTGSFVPFSIVGVAFAYLYWTRGSLWDDIACHAMFNFTSFLILIGGS